MQTKTCQNCKQSFALDADDLAFYEKMSVPAPTFCPHCRMIRRMVWRNERRIFRRKEALEGKDIFSGFPPEADVNIFENDYWNSDDWDQLATGMDYDPNKNFFEQFKALMSRAPMLAKSTLNMVNSDYCNEAGNTKNSYMCFNTDYCEDCAYSVKVVKVKDSVDIYEGRDLELCYDSSMIADSYHTMYSTDCENCVDVWFSKGLTGCEHCFGCVNLRKKKYHYFNEPLSKDEYEEKMRMFNSDSHEQTEVLRKKAEEFRTQFPVKYYHGSRNLNFTGERIRNSKNVHQSYAVEAGENMKYVQLVERCSDSYDYTVWGENATQIYEASVCGSGASNVKFCFNSWNVRDLEYCGYCFTSQHCFGCVGLHNKSYCIFNKQYTKEEYKILRARIIEDMKQNSYIDSKGHTYTYGEFFPPEFSPYAYNESIAHDFFPLDEDSAKREGFLWRVPQQRTYDKTIQAQDLPDTIHDVSDTIVQEIISCESCQRAYRIVASELTFYRKMNLPLPRRCHDCRFERRFKYVNPPKLYSRATIDGVEVMTSYAPDRSEEILSEEGFNNLVN